MRTPQRETEGQTDDLTYGASQKSTRHAQQSERINVCLIPSNIMVRLLRNERSVQKCLIIYKNISHWNEDNTSNLNPMPHSPKNTALVFASALLSVEQVGFFPDSGWWFMNTMQRVQRVELSSTQHSQTEMGREASREVTEIKTKLVRKCQGLIYYELQKFLFTFNATSNNHDSTVSCQHLFSNTVS